MVSISVSSNIPAGELPGRTGETGSDSLPARQLKQELADLQGRARKVLGNALLQHPACTVLKKSAQQALRLMKRIHSELQAETASPVASAEHLAQLQLLLATNHLVLDRIDSQTNLLEATCAQIISLNETTQKIMHLERRRYERIVPLAELVIDQTQRAESIISLLPASGLDVEGVIASRTGIEQSSVLLGALHTARLLAWGLRQVNPFEQELEIAATAGLLQDIGLIAMAPYLPNILRRGREHAQRLVEQHPATGAGMLGNLIQAPLALISMVGQHHERTDGTGYPRGLNGGQLPRLSRWLAVVNRFHELLKASTPTDSLSIDMPRRFLQATALLRHEAQRGTWDRAISEQLATQLEQTAQAKLAFDAAHDFESEDPVEAAGAESIRELHGEQLNLAGNHHGQPADVSHDKDEGRCSAWAL